MGLQRLSGKIPFPRTRWDRPLALFLAAFRAFKEPGAIGKARGLTERCPHSSPLAENLHQIWTIAARTVS